jgi:integrase
MKSLTRGIRDYLNMRRGLGFKLANYETDLNSFARFMKERGQTVITISPALEWARATPSSRKAQWARRLGRVRGFAQYWHAIDPKTEIPVWELMPYRSRHAHPYLYSEDEISRLLNAALRLPPVGALRCWTYYTLFGLLVCTGLRVSEATGLETQDVDLHEGILTIRKTKFGKSRLVPIADSTVKILSDYSQRRDRFLAGRKAVQFFVSLRGTPVRKCNLDPTFAQLSREVGIRGQSDRHGPRLHDFRHRFAIQTLVRSYHNDKNVDRVLPVLSTFLGHVGIESTYWYLSACPELLGAAAERLEQRWEA